MNRVPLHHAFSSILMSSGNKKQNMELLENTVVTLSDHSPITQELDGVMSRVRLSPLVSCTWHFHPCWASTDLKGSSCTNVKSEGLGFFPIKKCMFNNSHKEKWFTIPLQYLILLVFSVLQCTVTWNNVGFFFKYNIDFYLNIMLSS